MKQPHLPEEQESVPEPAEAVDALPLLRDPNFRCVGAVMTTLVEALEAGATARYGAGYVLGSEMTIGRDADAVGAVELVSTAATHGRYSMHITVEPRKACLRGMI